MPNQRKPGLGPDLRFDEPLYLFADDDQDSIVDLKHSLRQRRQELRFVTRMCLEPKRMTRRRAAFADV